MSLAAETNGGDVTSWIPLTNIFTPSSGCESIFRLNGPSLVAFDPGYGLDINTAVKCAPSVVTTWWEQARLGVGGNEHTAISIQPLICPDLWTTVATFMKDIPTKQIMCCPSGYSNSGAASGSVNGNCISSVSKGVVLTYASTARGASTDWSTATTTLSASSSIGAIAVVGYNVARATSTATPSSSASPTIGPSHSSTFSSLNEHPSSAIPAGMNKSTDNGMRTAVKIGIGLGAALGVLGIGALVLTTVLLRHRSRNKSDKSQAVAQMAGSAADGKMSNIAHGIQSLSVPSELPSREVHDPAELDAQGWSR